MMPASPRRKISIALVLSAAASAVGLGAFAVAGADTLIDRSFASAFSTSTGVGKGGPMLRDEVSTNRSSEHLWLTGTEPSAATADAVQPATIGERITMSVEVGRNLDLEVIAVSDISAQAGAESGQTTQRLVMVTCREIGASAGRIVRLIVDADEPLTAKHSPRAL